MARPDRMTVLGSILDVGFVPTFTAPDVGAALPVVRACWAGGGSSKSAAGSGRGGPR